MMNKKILYFSVVALFVCIILAVLSILFFVNKNDSQDKQIPIPIKEISLNEVRQHSTVTDCWTIIEQTVYDITPYISSHPGGAIITKACGTVGTEYFNDRVLESGESKGPHPQKAKDLLANYRLGILVP